MKNLAYDPVYNELKKDLKHKLLKWMEDQNDNAGKQNWKPYNISGVVKS